MIKLLTPEVNVSWDDYVYSSPDGNFFHLSTWQKVIEQAFGHQTYFYYYEENGVIKGVLPLTHIKSHLFGNNLISNAFSVYSGALADNGFIYDQLISQAQKLARELNVDTLELRNQVKKHDTWQHKSLYVTFKRPLDPDVEKNIYLIPKKRRAIIRNGNKIGLTSVIDEGIDRFYQAYSESVRNLGTPVFSKKYFSLLKKEFGDKCDIVTIERDGQLIASAMSFYYKGEVSPYYVGGTSLARDISGNDFMFWEVMRRAVERGFTTYDFGRSKIDTGSYNFKKHWGFEPIPLYYEVDLVNAKAIPEINPLNPKYKFFIAAWKKLPLPVSQIVGPLLAKDLG